MKNKILDAVAQLIEQYGLKKFTVDELAAELHISKKTLYQYFSGKDEMIREYFEKTLESDRQNVLDTVGSDRSFPDKIHAIVHSSHRYRLPVRIMDEAKQFYPDEWAKVKDLKQFKLDEFQKLLKQASDEGILRPDVHFGILSAMLERVSDLFLDTDFLLENGMKATQAIDEVLNIIIGGIVKKDEGTPWKH
ncbi:Bacterial regulatory proteins, tetR family [Caprobacter fermentans]|uniref:Bacterial regulatory proteins, tetR family n=1 Tax=Caproicibacter fermentans TaxID=2576756 RepID=A0A6N8I3V8_9FIRM|nr:TetR/AcrR family transcriptional regulator [Caproicibacter fermentans]MVB12280.1 Bacterial regulatory proteins, tetR family [Caproicibacter fermentans]